MDRLTGRDIGIAYFKKCFEEPCNGGGCDNPNCPIISHWVCERLAEYEDTGLTPAEAEAMKAELATLTAERDRFKTRAEAAEKDIQQMLRSDETCDLCVFCKCLYDEYCGCSSGAEWRGPQEGANQ